MSEQVVIDAELVRAWADLSGDHNRLHTDPEFAATTRYGRCIAHGPILASIVGELLATYAPRSAVAYRFVAPVYVPSTVTVSVTRHPAGADVECVDQDGTTVLTARASWTSWTDGAP
ncbi:MAG TPA: MaoC/PaaZ C-terminal domain-containing protein [Mycobacteriales bacterium]|nr:MaoC/PaaZ C-terminal domain-containing protein [Mycobacteriales bacterium]